MKTLHLSIIATVAVTVSAIIIAILASSFPQNQIPIYQYVIHEPYEGVDNNYGTVTLQNQTFHVTNINRMFDNESRPEWLQMYDVNFSFPNGIGPQNTPGGQIIESYVTFPDNPVPYRIAIGLGSSPDTTSYDYTTVLSTHKEPQAGFTIHNSTIQLLVNWSKIHSNIDIEGLKETYKTREPIDFQVNASGFDYFDAGATPDINITKSDGAIIWHNPHYVVLCCVPELTDFNRSFDITKLGGPVVLYQTGTYTVHVGYGLNSTEKEFDVVQSNQMTNISSINPLGVTGLVTYSPPDSCQGFSCPPYTFYLKINSNSTAYLLGYDICGNDLCVKNNTLSILLPINNIQIPNYTTIGLSQNKKWNYGDMADMRLKISPSRDGKDSYFLDIQNSTIVP